MASHATHAASPARTVFRALTEFVSGLLILASLAGVLQIGWQYWGAGLDTDIAVSRVEGAQTTREAVESAGKAAPHHTSAPPVDPAVPQGNVYGWMRIPRLGADWAKPIQQGVDKAELDNFGVGHYPSTAWPGAVGNASFAGHRAPADLGYMDRLRQGDMIYILGSSTWYAYRVTDAPYKVPMERTDVIGPTAAGAARALTLTTCDPMFSATPAKDRLIVHAEFVWWAKASEGAPAEFVHPRRTTVERVARTVRNVSERVDAPVTGVAALALGVAWLLVDGVMWLLCRRRMAEALRGRGSWSPAVWLWRVQAGPVASSGALKWVARLVRLVLLGLCVSALMFAMWRWCSPWIANNIPLFASPHPAVG